MQVKDELRVLVEAEVTRAIENFKKLSKGIDESEKKTVSLGDALDSFSKKSLIISGVLGGAGIAAVKFAGENQKLQLSLENMLGSAEEASAVFEEWRRLGASPGLNADEVFTLGKAMVNMGHDTRYATDTMKMLGDIAAGTGVSFGEISGSFERARAMGNLTTRDLVRLQQQGIPIVKQLAKELNTSEENIRHLADKGKIGFAELERAFKSMTSPGGQFAGMMEKLSGGVLEKFSSAADDAKQALASFGELLLPMATKLLDGASSILQGITNMEEGTKRFVLGMGTVIAVSGPVISAVKGIGNAISFLAKAHPVIRGISIAFAGLGVVTGFINKQANAYEDLQNEIKKTDLASRNLLSSYAAGNDEKVLDEKTTRELIKLYPELTGVIKANNTTVKEAEELKKALNAQNIESSQQGRIKNFLKDMELLSLANREIEQLKADIRQPGRGYSLDTLNQMLEQNITYRDDLVKKINQQRRDISEVLSSIGKELLFSGKVVDLPPVKIPVDVPKAEDIQPQLNNLKKTWQEWFSEITNVDHTKIGNSGAKAAQLYINEFERSLTAQSTIAKVLEDHIDIAGVLRSRQSEVQNALVELLSINPEEIDRPFTLIQEEIQNIIAEYHRLGEEAKKLEDNFTITSTLEKLSEELQNVGKDNYDFALASIAAANATEEQMRQAEELIKALREAGQVSKELSAQEILHNLGTEVQNLGKDQYDLALASMMAANATEEEMEQAEKMIDTLRRYGQSFDDFLSQKISGGLMNVFPDLEKQAAQAIGNISAQLASISFDSMLSGLSAVGELFAKGADGAEDFRQAMAGIAQQILNQLPNMFLQAGLQLIAQGQWPLGLGFVAAAGSSALIGGFVKGKTDVAANAHGNAFDGNDVVPYAHGGTFTNQIVNTPTFFKHGGKLGVMGEAGPESIMPLKRMANGDLGVAASGGGAKVTVNIINNAKAEVRQEEYTDSDGNKQIDVTLERLINNHITSGKADRAMARFGARPVGV